MHYNTTLIQPLPSVGPILGPRSQPRPGASRSASQSSMSELHADCTEEHVCVRDEHLDNGINSRGVAHCGERSLIFRVHDVGAEYDGQICGAHLVRGFVL